MAGVSDQTKAMLDDICNHLKAGGRAWLHLKRQCQRPNIGTHEIKEVDGNFLVVAVMEGWEDIVPYSGYVVPANSGGIDRIELEPIGGQGSCRSWGSEAAAIQKLRNPNP